MERFVTPIFTLHPAPHPGERECRYRPAPDFSIRRPRKEGPTHV